jgi:hypothetical protein
MKICGILIYIIFYTTSTIVDRLSGLVAIVPGYSSRFPGFDFLEVMGLERGPLSLVSTFAPAAFYSPGKVSGTHFCCRLSKTQGLVRLEGLGKLKENHSPHWVLNPRPYGL